MNSSDTIYRSDTGRYYSPLELWRRLEAGEWTPINWDEDSEKEWVETRDGDMLELTPVDPSSLPPDVSLVETDYGVAVEGEEAL